MQVGTLQAINTAMIENSEPDGEINWEEVINDSVDDSSSSESLEREGSPTYSFSDMYSSNETNVNQITYDPPASNTRRRKKKP